MQNINGSLLLEKLIASSNGRCNPIHIFSAEEMRKATNDYSDQQKVLSSAFLTLYRGFLQGREISIKKYEAFIDVDKAITDVVLGSQMSCQRNVVNLIGCSLESEIPVLVYEFAGGNTLSKYIYKLQYEPLPWKLRLRIAMDIANAVAHLYTALARPVLHRHLTFESIVFDTNSVAKLIDFSFSILIPEGKSLIQDRTIGFSGYSAPECPLHFTDKADVFSFGLLLLELLTGREVHAYQLCDQKVLLKGEVAVHVKNNLLLEIVDPKISSKGINQNHLVAFAKLALSCVNKKPEDRPTIIDAAKQLGHLYAML